MKQPLLPSTIGTQSRFAYFLTAKTVVRKFGKSDGQTGSRCLDNAVLAQRGGGRVCENKSWCWTLFSTTGYCSREGFTLSGMV